VDFSLDGRNLSVRMDAPTLTALVKELNEANAAGTTEVGIASSVAQDVIKLLTRFQKEVKASEELLRVSTRGLPLARCPRVEV
jgi:hypothetical protein